MSRAPAIIDELIGELEHWCAWRRMEHASADELLARCYRKPMGDRSPSDQYEARYLRSFLDRWDAAT